MPSRHSGSSSLRSRRLALASATRGPIGAAGHEQLRKTNHPTPRTYMEVILRQAVENLGKPGDVVKVSNGFARNHLLPRGIAFEATPGNLKRIAQEKSRLEA